MALNVSDWNREQERKIETEVNCSNWILGRAPQYTKKLAVDYDRVMRLVLCVLDTFSKWDSEKNHE